MSTAEDRLRDALRERAAFSPIDPDAWKHTVARVRPRSVLTRAWPRFIVPVAAAVAVIAIVAGAAALTGLIGQHGSPAAKPVTVPSTLPSTVPSPVSSPVSPAPGGCASQRHPANAAYRGAPASSITVCPASAPVGAVVHITLQGCNSSGPPAALVFLGPTSFVGSGGAGHPVTFKAAGGDRATATFTIPATYTGGTTGTSANRTLPVKPGDHYAFATYPAGICDVPFTITDAIRNLPVSSALRSQLTAAYAAAKGIIPADVVTDTGSVYYAYDPATGTYWALVDFAPSATAPQRVGVSMQEGTSWGYFTKTGSGAWRAQVGSEPVPCNEARFFPRAVLAAWSQPTNPTCRLAGSGRG